MIRRLVAAVPVQMFLICLMLWFDVKASKWVMMRLFCAGSIL